MNVRKLIVTQLRIFPTDTFSLATLATKAISNRIESAFDFRAAVPQARDEGLVGLAFSLGSFKDERGDTHAVSQLVIESRRIEIQVEGASAVADQFFSQLIKLLNELSGREYGAPIHTTEVTVSTVDLEFSLGSLLAPDFERFIANASTTSMVQPGHKVVALPSRIGFTISWVPQGEPQSVKLAEKSLNFEVRLGTRLEERVFFITSPTDSAGHLRLLEDLEKTFKGAERG